MSGCVAVLKESRVCLEPKQPILLKCQAASRALRKDPTSPTTAFDLARLQPTRSSSKTPETDMGLNSHTEADCRAHTMPDRSTGAALCLDLG